MNLFETHDFHMYVILISYVFVHILGPGTRLRAQSRAQSRAPKYEQHMNIIWNLCKIMWFEQFHIIFICISYFLWHAFHIYFTFWAGSRFPVYGNPAHYNLWSAWGSRRHEQDMFRRCDIHVKIIWKQKWNRYGIIINLIGSHDLHMYFIWFSY